MSSVKVSVIVPIYKAEQFIERCVRSLMEQSMKDDIEFVFVNDCTPDQSMQILERVSMIILKGIIKLLFGTIRKILE